MKKKDYISVGGEPWTCWAWNSESKCWLLACEHADMATCYSELIAYADRLGVEMRLTVLTPGFRPHWRLEKA